MNTMDDTTSFEIHDDREEKVGSRESYLDDKIVGHAHTDNDDHNDNNDDNDIDVNAHIDLAVNDSLESRTINKWRAYTHEKMMEGIAAKHWTRLKRHHAVIQWREQSKIQKQKRKRGIQHGVMLRRLIQRQVWNVWRHALDVESLDSDLITNADAQYKRNCLLHTYKQFHRYLIHSKQYRELQNIIQKSQLRHIASDVLKYWQYIKQKQNWITDAETHADRTYNDALLKASYYQWQELFRSTVVDKAKYVYANKRGNISIQRRVFGRWKRYVPHAQQHRIALCMRVVNTWRAFVANQRRHNIIAAGLLHRINNSVLHEILSLWHELAVSSRSEKLNYDRAVAFSEQHLLRDTISDWLYHTYMSVEHRKTQNADSQYKRRQQRCFINSLRSRVLLKQYDIKNMAAALQHLKTRQKRMTVTRWLHVAKCESVYRNLLKAYYVTYSANIVRDAFAVWAAEHEAVRHIDALMKHAHSYRLHNTLKQWRRVTSDSVQRFEDMQLAKRQYARTLLLGCLNIWVNEIHSEYQLHANMLQSAQPLLLRRSRPYFDEWSSAFHQLRHGRIMQGQSFYFWRRHAYKRYISLWKQSHQNQVKRHVQYNAAAMFRRRHLLQVMMMVWVKLSRGVRLRKLQYDRAYESIQRAVVIHTVHETMHAWFQQTKEILEDRIRTERGGKFHRHYLQRRAVHALTCHVENNKQHRQCMDKAIAMNCNQIQQSAFSAWKVALHVRENDLRKHIEALELWSNHLCKRAWGGWIKYHRHKKHEKQRRINAYHGRRLMLLRESTDLWLKASADMREERFEQIPETRSIYVQRVWRVVQCIALNWWRKTLRKRSNEENSVDHRKKHDQITRGIYTFSNDNAKTSRAPPIQLKETSPRTNSSLAAHPNSKSTSTVATTATEKTKVAAIQQPRRRPAPRKLNEVLPHTRHSMTYKMSVSASSSQRSSPIKSHIMRAHPHSTTNTYACQQRLSTMSMPAFTSYTTSRNHSNPVSEDTDHVADAAQLVHINNSAIAEEILEIEQKLKHYDLQRQQHSANQQEMQYLQNVLIAIDNGNATVQFTPAEREAIAQHLQWLLDQILSYTAQQDAITEDVKHLADRIHYLMSFSS